MGTNNEKIGESIKVLNFKTLQEAWEGINKYLIFEEQDVRNHGGGRYGTEFIAYNMLINVNNAWVDPEFDFGITLGYNIKKWTTLVKNYVDLNYLDLLKSEITKREGKKAKSYNYAFHFSNKAGGGKDCLLSLVFSRRVNEPYPTVFFNVRTSEVTCRLIFDFFLISRICEYVYGKELGKNCEIHFFAPSMFITAERFSIFADHFGWKKIKKRINIEEGFGKRVNQVYNHFKTTDVEAIKYKAHRRCAEVIQKTSNGDSVRFVKSMKAKELKLSKHILNLPKEVVTEKEIRNFLAKQND